MLPPNSGIKPIGESSCMTRSGFAPSLSILFIAMTMGTPAAFGMSNSFICLRTIPSSAANNNSNVCYTCSTKLSSLQCLMSRSVKDEHRATFCHQRVLALYRPQFRCDPTSFKAATLALPYIIQKSCLARSTWPIVNNRRPIFEFIRSSFVKFFSSLKPSTLTGSASMTSTSDSYRIIFTISLSIVCTHLV